MTYEIYRYIFVGSAVLAVIMLAVSVLLFFVLKIPVVIGDLTGVNARKGIESIRALNEKTGDKTYRSSLVNMERGKLTDKISQSGRIIKNPSHSLHGAMETEKIGTEVLGTAEGADQTTVLTEELFSKAEETTLLSEVPMAGETTLLDANIPDAPFVIEYELTYIHTNEIIGEA